LAQALEPGPQSSLWGAASAGGRMAVGSASITVGPHATVFRMIAHRVRRLPPGAETTHVFPLLLLLSACLSGAADYRNTRCGENIAFKGATTRQRTLVHPKLRRVGMAMMVFISCRRRSDRRGHRRRSSGAQITDDQHEYDDKQYQEQADCHDERPPCGRDLIIRDLVRRPDERSGRRHQGQRVSGVSEHLRRAGT